MKKFINSVDTMLAESLDGFVAAHAAIVALGPERKFVFRRSPAVEKVVLISGGGSGHEPLHVGFVGTGMSMASAALRRSSFISCTTPRGASWKSAGSPSPVRW